MGSQSIPTTACIIAAVLCTQTLAQDFFPVELEISKNGKTIATPVVITEEKTPFRLSQPGPDGYEIAVVVQAMQENQVKIAMNVRSEKYGSESPILISQSGQPATFRIGTLPENTVEIKITASPNKT